MSQPVQILLVEDQPKEARLTMRALLKAGCGDRVQIVQDGVEALEFIFCEGAFAGRRLGDHPQLILLDLKLPKVDGLEVLQRLKSDERTRAIPVVVLTSSREQRDIAASYRLGANSYIVKPVNFDQLSAAIQQMSAYWLRLNEPPGPKM